MLHDAVIPRADKKTLEIDGSPILLDRFSRIATGNAGVAIGPNETMRERVANSAHAVIQAVDDGKVIYGVTTGFGGMANHAIACEEASALQNNLLYFLAAGAGPEIESRHTRGAMLLRANVLLQGKSGVRFEVIERIIKLLQADAIPVVREYGSIGASGDLVPLGVIGRAITGQSDHVYVRFQNELVRGNEALDKLNLDPIKLNPKEGLALVNGTSFSSAIAANAIFEAKRLMGLSIALQSMLMRALLVDTSPFDRFVHQNKPHPGQIWSAQCILKLLTDGCEELDATNNHVQDRYSLRCFPQYNGSIVEGIARVQKTVETEMNAVSDNPLVDHESGDFFQSGNFLGQYIGVAMDELRQYMGLLAKHLDVQVATLVAPEFNGGLSASLRGNDERSYNMGLKGLQISGNSIMPMLTHIASPIVSHFPTHAEQFNQNVNGLSWGSANLAWKSVKMFQQYCAISLIFAVQAIDLRAKQVLGHFDGRRMLGTINQSIYHGIYEMLGIEPGERKPFLFNDDERWLEQDIETLVADISKTGILNKSIQPVIDSFDQHFGAGQ